MKVFLTRNIHDEGLNLIKTVGHTVVVNPEDRVLTKDELIAALIKEKPDALLCLLTDHIDGAVLDAAPQLKIVANYAVGFDNIDLDAANRRGIPVSNTPSLVVSDSVAEHTIALMLAVTHRIVEGDNFARAGRYKVWDPFLLTGTLLKGKTFGLLGLGRIGAEAGARAYSLGMHITYYDIKPNPDFEAKYGAHFSSKEEVLKNADVVSLHVPLNKDTKHLISTKELGLMKPSAFLINTARGPVVDEKAVLTALNAKKLSGFATDVYECEPAIDCDPYDHLEMRALPNVVMTPHIASATLEARQDMSRIAAVNILAAFAGTLPPNLAR